MTIIGANSDKTYEPAPKVLVTPKIFKSRKLAVDRAKKLGVPLPEKSR